MISSTLVDYNGYIKIIIKSHFSIDTLYKMYFCLTYDLKLKTYVQRFFQVILSLWVDSYSGLMKRMEFKS